MKWLNCCIPRLIPSGIGIAGPTLAYWLALYGFKTTLVESAPRLRKAARSNAGYEHP